jgi:serine/threonine protein kinase
VKGEKMVIRDTIGIGTVLGAFEIEKILGKGGMGIVYKAHESSLNRKVALKVLSHMLSADKEFITRFKKEAQIIAALNHPNIVSILSFGQDLGHYYFAMEYIQGSDLAQILKEKKIIPLEEALLITRQVADALSEAGKKGVVHRDLKPANIMIDEMNRVRVTDFGVARIESANDNLTKTGMFLGSPQYASPEQAEGLPIDPRSDIYALGAVLYRMLAGTPPTTADSPLAVVVKIVSETVTPIEQVNNSIPKPVCALIGKMMAKDLKQRYQNSKEVIADIDSCLHFLNTDENRGDEETIMQPPPLRTSPLKKNQNTLWWPWGAATAGILLLSLAFWGGNAFFSDKSVFLPLLQKTPMLSKPSPVAESPLPPDTETATQSTELSAAEKASDHSLIPTSGETAGLPAQTEHIQAITVTGRKNELQPLSSGAKTALISTVATGGISETMLPAETVLNTAEPLPTSHAEEKVGQPLPEQPTILLIVSGPDEMILPLQTHLESTLLDSNLQVISPAEIPILYKKMQIGELPVNWYNIRQFTPNGSAQVLVLAKIQKAGSTLLQFYGTSQEQISASFSVRVMDMNSGTMVEPSITGMIRYTVLNMQDEFQDTLATTVNKIGGSIREYWNKKRQGQTITVPVTPSTTGNGSKKNV